MYVVSPDDVQMLFAEEGGRVWIEHWCLDSEIMKPTIANSSQWP